MRPSMPLIQQKEKEEQEEKIKDLDEDSDSGYGESLLHSLRRKVLLVYNGTIEIEVNRYNVANSTCFFLSRMLAGPFRESSQSRIDIYLHRHISFEVFEGIVKYADKREFNRNHTELEYYLTMIQLANVWIYDELVSILETHLIKFIDVQTISVIHTLGNLLNLQKLILECLKLEYELDKRMGTLQRGWARCHLPGHQSHHYSNCTTFVVEAMASGWGSEDKKEGKKSSTNDDDDEDWNFSKEDYSISNSGN